MSSVVYGSAVINASPFCGAIAVAFIALVFLASPLQDPSGGDFSVGIDTASSLASQTAPSIATMTSLLSPDGLLRPCMNTIEL
jgi:hypothetical protein